jgi:hypothetical protein
MDMILRTSNSPACLHEPRIITIVDIVDLPPKQPPDDDDENEEDRENDDDDEEDEEPAVIKEPDEC